MTEVKKDSKRSCLKLRSCTATSLSVQSRPVPHYRCCQPHIPPLTHIPPQSTSWWVCWPVCRSFCSYFAAASTKPCRLCLASNAVGTSTGMLTPLTTPLKWHSDIIKPARLSSRLHLREDRWHCKLLPWHWRNSRTRQRVGKGLDWQKCGIFPSWRWDGRFWQGERASEKGSCARVRVLPARLDLGLN